MRRRVVGEAKPDKRPTMDLPASTWSSTNQSTSPRSSDKQFRVNGVNAPSPEDTLSSKDSANNDLDLSLMDTSRWASELSLVPGAQQLYGTVLSPFPATNSSFHTLSPLPSFATLQPLSPEQPPFSSPPDTFTSKGLDNWYGTSPRIMGLSGETDPALIARQRVDSQNECRFNGHRSVSKTRSIDSSPSRPINFLLVPDDLEGEAVHDLEPDTADGHDKISRVIQFLMVDRCHAVLNFRPVL
jgi:hypothetical protein